MCECGCGEFQAFAWMPGPAGFVYALGIYPPCNNGCDTPAGVVVAKLKQGSDDAKWIVHGDVPEARFRGSEDWGERFIAVLHPRDLRTAAQKAREKDSDEWFAIEEATSPDVLRDAMELTQASEFWWKDHP